MPVTALGGTAICTTSGELSSLSPAPRSENSTCRGQSASASVSATTTCAAPPAVPEFVLHVLGQPVDFGFGAFDANASVSRFRIADSNRSTPAPTSRSIATGGAARFASRLRAFSAIVEVGTIGNDRRRALRLRFHLERQLRDDAERAERTGEQLAEIVAGDVLHDAAAAFERHAAAIDGVDADHVVANRAVAVAPRAAPIRGHDAADRRFARARHIDRQLLPFGGERRGEVGHPHAGFDEDRHVARRVIDDFGRGR